MSIPELSLFWGLRSEQALHSGKPEQQTHNPSSTWLITCLTRFHQDKHKRANASYAPLINETTSQDSKQNANNWNLRHSGNIKDKSHLFSLWTKHKRPFVMKSKCLLRRRDRKRHDWWRKHFAWTQSATFTGKKKKKCNLQYLLGDRWRYYDVLSIKQFRYFTNSCNSTVFSMSPKLISFSMQQKIILWPFYHITARFIIYCMYTVWMALANSPPRSHQHKCVLSHWWQGDYIVLGGQRQCLFPQIQSKVHTGKEEREEAAEI